MNYAYLAHKGYRLLSHSLSITDVCSDHLLKRKTCALNGWDFQNPEPLIATNKDTKKPTSASEHQQSIFLIKYLFMLSCLETYYIHRVGDEQALF